VRTARQRLKHGHVVGIYPAGGFRDGAATVLGGAPLRRGIAAIAQLSGALVLPCVILGSDRLYQKQNWKPLRRVPVWIGFGEVMTPPTRDAADPDAARTAFEAALGENLRALAAEMRVHFGLSDADFPKSPRERIAGV
jgi:1-acyl-sn-glycerol-3-phosphate acyltransferase